MPTDIAFNGDRTLNVSVVESAAQIEEAITQGNGMPIVLQDESTKQSIYLNPLCIAYWRERKAYGGVRS